MTSLLERALAAEEEAELLRSRVIDLEARLKGVLGADPTTAVRALAWIGRAETGEELIQEIVIASGQRSINSTDLPAGWLARAEAQLAAVAILRRDQAGMAERPDGDESWERLGRGEVRHIRL